MSIDAMKQAIEALQHCLHYAQTHLQHFDAAYNRHPSAENERGVITDDIEDTFDAIGALRAAIEQAQEPVAWISESENLLSWDKFYDHMTPLYTAPRQWQGLTDEEVSEILDREIGFNSCFGPETDFARAIEAKLKEKNT